MFGLSVNNKIILRAKHYEDLIDFVEELKELNKKQCDRRIYKVISIGSGDIMKQWYRR